MLDRTFHEIELESWSQKASIYDRLFASVSTQAIAPILSSLGSLRGSGHLDVACGTGHLVAEAAKKGAITEGVDFAVPMVDAARKNYPHLGFKVADAADLPYRDAYFDAVSCSFGLPHMANPQSAVQEAFRVLKPGGRYAFTLWFSAEDGGEFHTLVKSAIQAHATENITLPETWTVMRFASESVSDDLVRQAGFLPPMFQRLNIAWHAASAQQVLEFVEKLSLRTMALINTQLEPVRARIYAQIIADAEKYRRGSFITLAWPALLTVAQKPE